MKPTTRPNKLQLGKTTLRNLKDDEARRVAGGTLCRSPRVAGGTLCRSPSSTGGTTIVDSGAKTCVSCYQDSNCYC
jgi:hypothetical protein